MYYLSILIFKNAMRTHTSLIPLDLLVVSENFPWFLSFLGLNIAMKSVRNSIGKELSISTEHQPQRCFPEVPLRALWVLVVAVVCSVSTTPSHFPQAGVWSWYRRAFLCWSGLLTLSPPSLPAGLLRCAVFGEGQHPHWTSKCSPGPWAPGMPWVTLTEAELTPGLEVWVW